MVTTRSSRRTSNQQDISVLISHISLSTSSQGQVQEIMAAPDDGLQDPYLAILYLATSDQLKIYNKVIVLLLESKRCDLIISKRTNFYQELDNAASTFGFKAVVIFSSGSRGSSWGGSLGAGNKGPGTTLL